MKKVSVVGLGYIGLPTAILSAQSGYDVFGFDVDVDKVSRIKKGDPTIAEPEISERLTKVLAAKNLDVGTRLRPADCFVVAVPTPFKEDKKADSSFVFGAAESIAAVLKEGDLILLESTIPVGTTAKVFSLLEEKSGLKAGRDFFVAHCPERVLPGRIFHELVLNDRVVGGINRKSSELAQDFYIRFVKGDIFLTDDKTAEMVKLVENSSRDVQIAFANQVAGMARRAWIEPREVINLANRHPRVNVLNPGCGVGGHCIAVDPWFLIETFSDETKLLRIARNVNDARPLEIVDEVLSKIDLNQKSNVLVLGVTFKPNVDDVRESPALKIALELNKHSDKLNLLICEPNVEKKRLEKKGLSSVGLKEGLLNSDLILSLVLHKEFQSITKEHIKDKKIIDTCGLIYDLNKSLNDDIYKENFTKQKMESEKIL